MDSPIFPSPALDRRAWPMGGQLDYWQASDGWPIRRYRLGAGDRGRMLILNGRGDMIEKYLTNMYRKNADFVFTVSRDFVKSCQTPVLIMPDDIPAHPYVVAMECAMTAPKAEVSMYPWKEPKERIPLAIRQIKSFLKAHRPVTA